MDLTNYKRIITSRKKLQNFLTENKIALKKRFGQNFLYDKNVIDNIISEIDFQSRVVIEIGPGLGALTLFYYNLTKKNILIEIDKKLYQILNSLGLPNTEIIHKDILKINLSDIFNPEKRYTVISNLPYNIASQILIKLINHNSNIEKLFIMVPDILYKRITAKPADKNYSRITIAVQTFFSIKKLISIKKNSFFPVPEVDSVFLKLSPHNKYTKKIINKNKFFNFVKISFSHRRKKLHYVLSRYYNIHNNLYGKKRIEELEIDQIIELINAIVK